MKTKGANSFEYITFDSLEMAIQNNWIGRATPIPVRKKWLKDLSLIKPIKIESHIPTTELKKEQSSLIEFNIKKFDEEDKKGIE